MITYWKALIPALRQAVILRQHLPAENNAAPGFSTPTKGSEDETSFGTCYDVKEVRISQEKHLSSAQWARNGFEFFEE